MADPADVLCRQDEQGVCARHPEEHLQRVPGRAHAPRVGRAVPEPRGRPDAARRGRPLEQRQPVVRQDTAGQRQAHLSMAFGGV